MADGSISDIIQAKPIGKGLNAFRDSFSLVCQDLGVPDSLESLDRIGNEGLQNLALNLVSALQTLPAARLLHSTSGGKNLFSDLLRLPAIIGSDDFDIEPIIPLLKAVLDHETDELVWDRIYSIVAQSTLTTSDKPSTPPPSGLPHTSSFQQTPWTFNAGSFAYISDLRKDVDPIIKNVVGSNLMGGSLMMDHPYVLRTFFGEMPLLWRFAEAVVRNCKDMEGPLFQEGVGWVDWPASCEEASVLRFLRCHINQFLLSAGEYNFRPTKRRRYITTPNKPVPGSVSKRKLDVGLAYNSYKELEDGQGYDWSHILVPGELKSNAREDNHHSTRLDLLRYAQEIFNAQDTRRFVRGFTLCGSIMRLWEFDRLGGIGSTAFDINEDGEMFVYVILGYLWMSEEELGFDATIKEDNEDTLIFSGEVRRSESI